MMVIMFGQLGRFRCKVVEENTRRAGLWDGSAPWDAVLLLRSWLSGSLLLLKKNPSAFSAAAFAARDGGVFPVHRPRTAPGLRRLHAIVCAPHSAARF